MIRQYELLWRCQSLCLALLTRDNLSDVTETKIAFYSPLKPPDHVVPSGDRLMAQLLIDCLQVSGYSVDVVSRLRVFIKDPQDHAAVDGLKEQAQSEIHRLTELWAKEGPPLAWFCYHTYYKSPDLIGPALCEAFDIPYVTAETSYSSRRTEGLWGACQDQVIQAVKCAAVNICFTERDRLGLKQAAPSANLAMLRPFIDTNFFTKTKKYVTEPRLVAVAMMRAGDKMNSYIKLAAALRLLLHLPWRLSVIGDGPLRDDVQALFADIPADRIIWHGRREPNEIAVVFAQSTLYVWPGCGEAYGLAYLEAQAAGLPVVAFDTAGVPEVVDGGYSGVLTTNDDEEAYAAAIEKFLENEQYCALLSNQASAHVQHKHSFEQACKTLNSILYNYIGPINETSKQ